MENTTPDIIDTRKWAGFLLRFIDVLKINIFMVDTSGRLLVSPYSEGERPRYGSQCLTRSFNFDLSGGRASLLAEFKDNGGYLESHDPFDFRVFAVPIMISANDVIAYLIVGPVVLNKKWDHDHYTNLANQLNMTMGDFEDIVHEIRVVSFVAMKSILDLLSEVVKDIVQLNMEMKSLKTAESAKEKLSRRFTDAARDIYATIHLDKFLITVLDIAITLSAAEGGSIMVLDDSRKELTIKVYRGLDPDKVASVKTRFGEGIAGTAAKENVSFLISGAEGGDNRIKRFLSRPDLKQSLVMPLTSSGVKVFGVLNLHSREENSKLLENVDKLKPFLQLISTSLQCL